jgi:hypothetical protein
MSSSARHHMQVLDAEAEGQECHRMSRFLGGIIVTVVHWVIW